MIGNHCILAISAMVLLRLYLACGESFDTPNKYVPLHNDSNETIYYFDAWYPDTLSTPLLYGSFERFSFNVCEAKESVSLGIFFDNEPCDDEYQIIILKESTLRNYSEEQLKTTDIYDERIFIPCKDIKKPDFEIHYTGD